MSLCIYLFFHKFPTHDTPDTGMAAHGSCKKSAKDLFEGVPDEIKYKIFAGLDAKDIALARTVCKKWDGMLSPSAIQGRSQFQKSESSDGFLVKVSVSRQRPKNIQPDHVFSARVDGNGIWTRERILDNVNLTPEMDVTCNGTVFAFSPLVGADDGQIVVCNPSLRWKVLVPRCPCDQCLQPHDKYDRDFQFTAACYEPSTGCFTLLIGHACYEPNTLVKGDKRVEEESHKVKYTIHIYRSETREWETLTLKMPREYYVIPFGESVYSRGHFLWMDGLYPVDPSTGVLAFSLSIKQFFTIALPDCQLHPDHGGTCVAFGGFLQDDGDLSHLRKHDAFAGMFLDDSPLDRAFQFDSESWALKGGPGNVVAFHYINCNHDPETQTEDHTVAWTLVQNDDHVNTWKWMPLPLRMDKCKRHVSDRSSFYNTNKMGHWLWCPNYYWRCKSQMDLVMVDDKGDLLHSICVSVNDISTGCYAAVEGLWVFETNNLWQILQSP